MKLRCARSRARFRARSASVSSASPWPGWPWRLHARRGLFALRLNVAALQPRDHVALEHRWPSCTPSHSRRPVPCWTPTHGCGAIWPVALSTAMAWTDKPANGSGARPPRPAGCDQAHASATSTSCAPARSAPCATSRHLGAPSRRWVATRSGAGSAACSLLVAGSGEFIEPIASARESG